tara:strand:- start:67 stop:330 length:264 start_codon:yes stop_codon:yes gene_type:complete
MKLNRAEEVKIKEIAEKYDLSVKEVESIISSPYSFIHQTTKSMVLKDNMTREEFDETKTNFNLPSIGKLYASYFMYNEIQKKKNKKN